MRILSLDVKDWRLLKEPQIQLRTACTVIIGENGSGKSTLIELILNIFDFVYKRLERPRYHVTIDGYCLRYEIERDGVAHQVEIESGYFEESKPGELHIKIDDRPFYVEASPDMIRDVLPSNILVYYAGDTDRLEQLCGYYFEHNARTLANNGGDYTLTPLNLPKRSPFIYSDIKHLDMVLLSLLVNNQESATIDKLDIDKASVAAVIKLKKPGWATKNESDDLWGNKSKLIEEFISSMIARSTQTLVEGDKRIIIEIDVNVVRDFLTELAVQKKGMFLFDMFELLRTNELLEDVSLNWHKRGAGIDGETISAYYFSEGEKQVILTSALVEFWDEEQCLFLMDEPDTFLHPSWQSVFLPELQRHLRESHVIITTHSVLMLSTIKDGCDLYMMKKGKMIEFNLNIYGMDANEIITLAMETAPRAQYVDNLMRQIQEDIKKRNLDSAKEKLKELKGYGVSEFNINRLRSTIERFETIGR